jgi:vitamin B12 transporter
VFLSFLFFVLMTPWAAAAPAADDPVAADAIDETLIVLGSRTPVPRTSLAGSVSRLDAGDLRSSRVGFLADLLRTIPATALNRSGALGNLTQVRMRGSEANHTLVLLDGLEANDPATGSEFDFAHLRAPTIESVEVLPGPSGALWGSDAIGGAIALRTPRARGPMDWGLRLAGGERDRREASVRAGHVGERFEVNAVADHFSTEGTNIARRGDERDGYRVSTLALHGAVDLSDRVRLQGILRTLGADVEFDPAPAPGFLPADGDRETDVRRTLAGLHLDLDPQGALSHRLTLEQLSSDHADSADGRVTDERRGDRSRIAWQSNLEFEALGRQRLSLAAEVEREGFAQRGTASAFGDPNQNQTLTHRAVTAEWRHHLDEVGFGDTHLAAVVRRDFNEAFDDATHLRLSARTALPLDLGDGWVSLSRATKNPTFGERFGFTPDSFLGNPDLTPEQGRGIELGWTRSFADDRLRAELLWYRTRLEDEIDGFVFDPATGAFTARNRDADSRREGTEASLRLQLTAATRIRLRHAFVDASEPDASGGRVREIRRPRHSGSVSIDHAFRSVPASLRIDAVWNGPRDDRDFATFPATVVELDDHLLVGAALSWSLAPGVDLFVRGENLLDEQFEEVLGYRGPGRALHAGIELRAR